MTPQNAYDELALRAREMATLASTQAVLEWDQQTYMPPGAAAFRAQQMSMLAGMVHDKFTDPKVGELIAIVEGSDLVKDPDSIIAANIRELRHNYDKETKLPKELVEEFNKTTVLAHNEWAAARKASDFKKFQPWLEKIVTLCRRKADAYGYTGEPYNALLDNYEPGASVEEIAVVFEKVRIELVSLLSKINNSKKKPDVSIVERPYDVERQKVFGEMVAAAMGYDFTHGRLDIAVHPMTIGIGPGDTRITTRYNPRRLNDALFGTIHEAGHALYDMALEREKYLGLATGDAASLGIHESQSRMWENMVGRSKAFWVYFFPQAKRIFRDSLDGVELDDFYKAVNNVAPSYIRVEADEVTYNLHIMLRFELERALMTGQLKPADIPGEWNSRFKKYFGIAVDHDANGCLQDVHWSAGLIGYFPTYSLGNLYAAQFFAKIKQEIPDLTARLEKGDLLTLREWLREKIHKQGLRYRAGRLCQKVTGQPLSHQPLIDYMKAKFGEIYGF
jgi:carboxypeptidase Taq